MVDVAEPLARVDGDEVIRRTELRDDLDHPQVPVLAVLVDRPVLALDERDVGSALGGFLGREGCRVQRQRQNGRGEDDAAQGVASCDSVTGREAM